MVSRFLRGVLFWFSDFLDLVGVVCTTLLFQLGSDSFLGVMVFLAFPSLVCTTLLVDNIADTPRYWVIDFLDPSLGIFAWTGLTVGFESRVMWRICVHNKRCKTSISTSDNREKLNSRGLNPMEYITG